MIKLPSQACTGCGLCADLCPKQAISLRDDIAGDKTAVLDSTICCKCGLCVKYCPVLKGEYADNRNDNSMPYAAWAKDAALREHSTSGGVFAVLATAVLQKGGLVVGAAIDGTTVRHIIISEQKELIRLQGAKYLYSDASGCYKKVLQYLRQGRVILFSGTPCQVAAVLSACSPEERKYLLTVDLICHGVPSTQIIKLVEFIQKKRIKQIVSFRDKVDNKTACVYLNESGEKDRPSKDPFYELFFSDLLLRKNCYVCPFSGIHRLSDLTIGDFWGDIRGTTSHVNSFRVEHRAGISLVFCHSGKGEDFLKSSAIALHEVELRHALDSNPSIYSNAKILSFHPVIIFRLKILEFLSLKLQYRLFTCGKNYGRLLFFLKIVDYFFRKVQEKKTKNLFWSIVEK